MSNWRDSILDEFVPQVSKLTLVADPDGLLGEEKLALALRQRGFDLIEFTDAVAFRYAYESNYRSVWDRGDYTDLVVILRLQDITLEGLPYDLLQAGRRLAFSLGKIFPTLSYPVLEQLDPSRLDALSDAQQKVQPGRMGDNASKDFVLRHVYGVAAELVNSESDLLRLLLRLHYPHTHLPKILSDRLVHLLQAARPTSALSSDFQDWPLAEIVPDGDAFFAFLQERWPIFLDRLDPTCKTGVGQVGYALAYTGPMALPFDHQDILVYIDNLFVEGILTPVTKVGLGLMPGSWIRSGLLESNPEDGEVRLTRLFDLVEKEWPALTWRHTDWTGFAQKWAELSALAHKSGDATQKSRFLQMGDALNRVFVQWLDTGYASLLNQSPSQPAMLHHVARRLEREMEESPQGRVALLVLDGLALDQWVTVRQVLQEQMSDLIVRESAVFAWIPTLTAISRQTIFSGKIPLYFPNSLSTTNKEDALWSQFWENTGLPRTCVAYQRNLGDGNALDTLDTLIHRDQTQVVGLVVDKVDKIIHGMQLGAAGMHGQVKQWCEGGYLASLIGDLLDRGFAVWMTSDHGNIECVGQGRPNEGVIADTRGQRARIYPTPELRAQVADNFPFAHEWFPVGLPGGLFPLTISGSEAFITQGERTVSHGGMAMEEVIVPLVKFERRSR